MPLYFSVKDWRAKRPEAAKDAGVAKAIKEVDKDCGKPTAAMTEKEVKAAGDAATAMKEALDAARKEIQGDGKGKDRTAVLKLISDWIRDCDTYLGELNGRTYRLKVEKVMQVHHATYSDLRDTLIRHLAEAQAAVRDGTPPEDKTILTWMGSIRDTAKVCSKQFVTSMSAPPEAKQIKVGDVDLPNDVAATKAKVKALSDLCIAFSKNVKRAAKGAGAQLDDSKGLERELKAILSEFRAIEAKMKPLVQRAGGVAALSKQLADSVKRLIEAGDTDDKKFKKLAADLKTVGKELEDRAEDVTTINKTWREGSGALAQRAGEFRRSQGYDDKTHGQILMKQTNSAMMSIRRATEPLADGRRQIQRAIRLMDESTSHRGYAGLART